MVRLPKMTAVFFAACAGLFANAQTARAAEITMITSNMLKAPVTELVARFEKATGNKVTLIWGPAVDIPPMIEKGQRADLVIIPSEGIEDFIDKHILATGSRTDFAKSLIGVATRKGAPRPDISSGDALKKSLLAAKSIAISGGTSSFYLKDLFKKWGIAEAIAPKLQEYGPGTMGIAQVLDKNLAEIGFTQATAFVNDPNLDYIGPLPHDIEEVAIFSAGRFESAAQPEAAKALVKFLTAPEAGDVLRKYGFAPA